MAREIGREQLRLLMDDGPRSSRCCRPVNTASETASAYIIAELPDSVSAAAAITAATKDRRLQRSARARVLTRDQYRDMVALAQSSEKIYRPPGQAAVEREVY